ncbi:MAG: protein-L-isoaspartate(D-aspartate) O-methyltransferase [Betaproteobacteria bacterium]|nr:protein-L-isoaspartate(D-aspartate) O-methyltransferase [Betaproteobacteria bacterium]
MTASKTRGIGFTSQRTRDRMIERLRAQGVQDETVLAAMATVPRHLFVDEALASRAYEDMALPIGFEQTISQPVVVAVMIAALRRGREGKLGKVLEIGTGCGYQAAVLAQVSAEVYSMERISGLLERARANLRELRLRDLRLAYGDGANGLPEAAPFDAIILAASTPEVPAALKAQLAVGGRLIAPLIVKPGSGAANSEQTLYLLERTSTGWSEQWLDAVRFVPLRAGKQ